MTNYQYLIVGGGMTAAAAVDGIPGSSHYKAPRERSCAGDPWRDTQGTRNLTEREILFWITNRN